jgi:gamma-glutamyltranspeptidase/glutathione hydrolase
MVASADALATQAGLEIAALGGNAVDTAIATNAAIAVTGPHLCGMGGDLFALVHRDGEVFALNSTGRAGSGADAAELRSEGHESMPFRHDIRTVTVPGCVDGWVALHERFGSLPLTMLLEPAARLAHDGFPASPLLVGSIALLTDAGRASLYELSSQARRPGDRVRRPGVARALRAVGAGGRDAFYLGEFGDGLRELGGGLFSHDDLATPGATWVQPLLAEAFGHVLATIPPNSQGYLTLGSALLADELGLPEDTASTAWAHLLVEAAAAAGHDRPDVLHEAADGDALVRTIAARVHEISRERASARWAPGADGDTTYLCTVDRERMGVSLIQSNASGFGSWLAEPNTGINLHNRGLGFSLTAGHPAEYGPGRRPPHTLCPALAMRPDGSLAAVFGTMGGDGQPQILLQVAARLFHHGQSPAEAIGSGRWVMRGPVTGFDTWTSVEGPTVMVEGHAPTEWVDGLRARGHQAERTPDWDSAFGHAHAIVVQPDGFLAGAADPRSRVGSCAGTA